MLPLFKVPVSSSMKPLRVPSPWGFSHLHSYTEQAPTQISICLPREAGAGSAGSWRATGAPWCPGTPHAAPFCRKGYLQLTSP